MRDIRRISRILGKLMQLWLSAPDLRLCQLLSILAPKEHGSDLFHLEDSDLEEAITSKIASGW